MQLGRMRGLKLFQVLFVAAGVVAFDFDLCPRDQFLVFNNTNVDFLAQCSQFNYTCRPGGRVEDNSTTGPPHAPANCSVFSYEVRVDKNINGSLSIPLLASANPVIEGQALCTNQNCNDTLKIVPLNLTSLELPDLVNASDFEIRYADKIETLRVPKLTSVDGRISINISGENPPPINLSFPSLTHVHYGILLTGHIDAVELPVLNSTSNINIISTGNLDCAGLATKLVNSTSIYYQSNNNIGTYGPTNNSFICNSTKGNVVTYHKKASGGSSVDVKWVTMVLVWFLGCISVLL